MLGEFFTKRTPLQKQRLDQVADPHTVPGSPLLLSLATPRLALILISSILGKSCLFLEFL